jgi:hypothetical protein
MRRWRGSHRRAIIEALEAREERRAEFVQWPGQSSANPAELFTEITEL